MTRALLVLLHIAAVYGGIHLAAVLFQARYKLGLPHIVNVVGSFGTAVVAYIIGAAALGVIWVSAIFALVGLWETLTDPFAFNGLYMRLPNPFAILPEGWNIKWSLERSNRDSHWG